MKTSQIFKAGLVLPGINTETTNQKKIAELAKSFWQSRKDGELVFYIMIVSIEHHWFVRRNGKTFIWIDRRDKEQREKEGPLDFNSPGYRNIFEG